MDVTQRKAATRSALRVIWAGTRGLSPSGSAPPWRSRARAVAPRAGQPCRGAVAPLARIVMSRVAAGQKKFSFLKVREIRLMKAVILIGLALGLAATGCDRDGGKPADGRSA